jgi:hypothetical protein
MSILSEVRTGKRTRSCSEYAHCIAPRSKLNKRANFNKEVSKVSKKADYNTNIRIT